ncbi:hypothetical protein AB0J72_50235 [Dactylosporangium sp. NPDC049742]|uniref:hypothetical protein n=1 Tax=Dactylosporangium sp. NPDC049742 TaxID=3154737 RepID=UPI003437FAC7
MSGIEDKLVRSLAARAGATQVEAGELARLAVRRAGRMRARRRVAGVAAAVVLIVGAAVGVQAMLPQRKDTTLPVALGVPSALSRPEGIGADPALLHLDLDLKAFDDVGVVDWVSGEDRESVTVYGQDHELVAAVYVAPTVVDLKRGLRPLSSAAVDVTVGGRPGRADTFDPGNGQRFTDLRWEPVDGIFVAVWARDLAAAQRVYGAVRLDRVQRCVTPMRLSELPAGARWVECQTATKVTQERSAGEWAWSGLVVAQADVERVRLWAAEPAAADGARFAPDRVVAGRSAQWLTDGMRGLWVPGFGPVSLYVLEATAFHADLLSEDEAAWYVEHLQVYDDLTNPDAWPTSATR